MSEPESNRSHSKKTWPANYLAAGNQISQSSVELTEWLPDFDSDSIPDPGWFFATLIDSLPVNVVCKNTEGRFIYVNQAFVELMNRPAEDFIGKTDFDISTDELARKYLSDDRVVMETGKIFREIEEIVTGDNSSTFFEVRKSPLLAPDGSIFGIKAVFWDVTAQKRAELAAEHEKFLLDALMDNVPDSIYFKDTDSKFMRISTGMANKFDISDRTEMIGQSDADLFSAEHAQRARQDELKIMRSQEPILGKVEKETWQDHLDTWCSSTKLPLIDPAGKVVGTFGISRDITDLVRTEEALRKAIISAESANRAKSDFLANMSHEIRTPMNAVLGITELLLETDLQPMQRDYLNMVLSSGESLLSLINDILDFSKIESGKFELIPIRFDLRDTVGDTARVLGMRAYDKELELAFSVDPDVPNYLIGDIGRLRQVIINLVGNAIKFTKAGEVMIGVECVDCNDETAVLKFVVSDTGIGIPASKLELVFREFEQADASTTRDYGGTGLGLAISSRLVELMGGKIWVESTVGKGSKFAFTAQFKIAAAEPSDNVVKPMVVDGTPALIVDDNETNRMILKNMLLNWGMKPIVAESAEQALELFRESSKQGKPFSLILTDVNMPTMDGFGLTDNIRSMATIAETAVIMLTSGMREGDLERCRQLGVGFHLIKPLKQAEVFDAIVTVLGVGASSRTGASSNTGGLAEFPNKKSERTEILRVLLVEDNIVNQKLAIGVLGQQGHQVTVADNGKEAIKQWQGAEFDLILMDVQMPLMDGFQATQEIRRQEKETGRHIPIIAMTARAMEKDRDACLAAGMDDYLSKPIRIKELAERLVSIDTIDYSNSIVGESRGPDPGLHPKRVDVSTIFVDQNGDSAVESPTTMSMRGLVDWQAAESNVNGDQELLAALVQVLRTNGPRLIEKIETAIQNADPAGVKLNSHTLKGSVLFLGGDVPLSKVAAKLESKGERTKLSGAGVTMLELKREWRRLELELGQWLTAKR